MHVFVKYFLKECNLCFREFYLWNIWVVLILKEQKDFLPMLSKYWPSTRCVSLDSEVVVLLTCMYSMFSISICLGFVDTMNYAVE